MNPLNPDEGAGAEMEPGLYMDIISFSVHPVPVPASILLLSTGILGLAGFRKKFKK